jgi:hypothetical protein
MLDALEINNLCHLSANRPHTVMYEPSNVVDKSINNVLILIYLLLITTCSWSDDDYKIENSCLVIQ